MTYEAGFCVFAFVVFCAVVVCLLYRRALVVDDAVRYEVLLSRDDVLDLASHTHVGVMGDSIAQFCADAAGSQTGAPEAWDYYADCTQPTGWQPHDTGKLPVSWGCDVVVMFRDGTISNPLPAKDLCWMSIHDVETDTDILAYRIA